MKPGEDAVLPGMVGRAVLGEHNASRGVADRMEVWPQFRVHHERGEIDPRLASRNAGPDVEALPGAFELNPGIRSPWPVRSHRGRAGDRFGSGIGRWFVQ